jgi:predicted ester cyclase
MTKSALTLLTLSLLAAAPTHAAKKETLRQVMDRYFAVVDGKQMDRLAEVDAADLEMITPVGTFRGVEGHKALMQGFATALPNFKHTVTRCIESGDTIACEGTYAGDHNGPMRMPNGQTVAPTHKHIDIGWAGLAKVKNGKVTSIHVYFDTMAMMQQLGLVPPPPTTASAK